MPENNSHVKAQYVQSITQREALMKSKNGSQSALLILDMLNTFDFKNGHLLAKKCTFITKNILRLKKRFTKKRWPVIYVNDNFGQWRSDWRQIFSHCSKSDAIGRKVATLLKPEVDDYFILKPRNSGFHHTALEVLLEELNINNLVIVGIAGNICVHYTAHDAHMRKFNIIVPSDCVASQTDKENRVFLYQLKTKFKVRTAKSQSLRLK